MQIKFYPCDPGFHNTAHVCRHQRLHKVESVFGVFRVKYFHSKSILPASVMDVGGTMEIVDAIHGRQTISKVKPDGVPRELIEKILSAAVQAPNYYQVRPWRFVVFSMDWA